MRKMDKEEKAKRHREYNREWSNKNKERVTSRRKELYQKNKDKINLQRREYWQKNKDKKRAMDKRYYLKNKPRLNEKQREYHRKKENDFLSAYKTGKSCALCGYNEHCEILQFHHKDRREKLFEVTLFKIAKRSPEELKKEIDKCILICPNCHFLLHLREMESKNE